MDPIRQLPFALPNRGAEGCPRLYSASACIRIRRSALVLEPGTHLTHELWYVTERHFSRSNDILKRRDLSQKVSSDWKKDYEKYEGIEWGTAETCGSREKGWKEGGRRFRILQGETRSLVN